MDEQVDQLAAKLRWVVDDEQAGTGHYAWRPDADGWVDPEVAGFLVNHYRTAVTALANVTDRLHVVERELKARAEAEQLDLLERPPGRPVVDVPLPDVVVMEPGEEVVPRGRTDPPARTDPPGRP